MSATFLKNGEFLYCLSCPPAVGPQIDTRILKTITDAVDHLKTNPKHRVVLLRDFAAIAKARGLL